MFKLYLKRKKRQIFKRLGMILMVLFVAVSALAFPVTTVYAAAPAGNTALKTSNQKLDKVVLQLRWDHQFQFSGYYQALWQGYYEEAGLDVEIRSGFDENRQVLKPTQEVLSGNADFGIGTSDILLDMGEGDLKIISSLFQKSPTEFYLLRGTTFTRLQDINTLNAARRYDDTLDIELQAMMISRGIVPDPSRLRDASMSVAFNDLLTGRFDMIPSYLGTMDYYAKKSGTEVRIIRPIDYGIDFYGDSLFTSTRLTTENPELVERFRKASLKGWTYALQHTDETSDRIAERLPREDMNFKEHAAYNRFQAGVVTELMLYPVVEIGNLNPLRWDHMQQTLKELGFIETVHPIETLIFDYSAILEASRITATEKRQGQIVSFVILLVILIVLYLIVRNRVLGDEISERQKAEAALSRSNARHQSIFDNAVLAIIMTDQNGVILQANGTWARMTGYPLDELLGLNILDLVAPNSRDQGKEELAALNEGQLEKIEFERAYIRKDGDVLHGRVFMTRIKDPETGEMVNLGMVEDITHALMEEEAVLRSETRFRAIVDDIATEIGPEGQNPELLSRLEDDAPGRERLSLKLEQINLELERLFKKELDENRQKEALIAHQGRLAAMGEMVANIAHQWRQPLNNLSLILSNLEDGFKYQDLEPDDLSKAIEKSKRLIRKMSDTIDDFRDFLKPDSTPVAFSPKEEIETVLDFLEENLRFNKVAVVVRENAVFEISGSRQGFSQVLFNLVTNAIDAMTMEGIPEDRRQIVITLTANTPSDLNDDPALQRCYEIAIHDTGPGIPATLRDEIFNAYVTTKTGGKGTGLGLYIARSIIENQFGGALVLEGAEAVDPGEPGEFGESGDSVVPAESGATFVIRFPEKRPSATQNAPSAQSIHPTRSDPA
ncbi:MAG: ABC transporter substrate-binding protein [Erysipelotrichaceae bacterium]|nr:ABC transporter substrate-binding protein [Erysipelotrichaceae bacterium]